MKTKMMIPSRLLPLFALFGFLLLIGLAACAGEDKVMESATAIPTSPAIPTETAVPVAQEEIVPLETEATAVASSTAVPENSPAEPMALPEPWHPIQSLGARLIGDVDISPDGSTALLGTLRGYLTIVNLNDLSTQTVFFEPNSSVRYLQFLPDSQHFIAGTTSAGPTLIDSQTGETVQTFPLVGSEPLALSPDGTKLAGINSDFRTIEIWDIVANQRITAIEGTLDRVNSMAFSADGSQLATTNTASFYAGVAIWDVATGEQTRFLQEDDTLEAVTFSPDGRYIATGLSLWDAVSGERLDELGYQITYSWDRAFVEFSPDSRQLLIINQSGQATLVDVATLEPIFQNMGGSNSGNLADFSPDSQTVLLGSQLLDVQTGALAQQLGGHTVTFELGRNIFTAVTVSDISPDGRLAFTAGAEEDNNGDGFVDPSIKVWEIDSGKIIHTLTATDYPFIAATFSPDGTKILAKDETQLTLWDVATGGQLFAVPYTSGNDGETDPLAFTPDGTRFFATDGQHVLTMHNANTGEILQTYAHDGNEVKITAVAILPDGQTVITSGEALAGAFIRSWQIETGELVSDHQLDGLWEVSGIAISPDGTQLVSLENYRGSNDPTLLRILNPQTFAEQTAFTMNGRFASAAYFPDGQQLLVGGEDGIVILDTITGSPLEQFDGLTEHVVISESGERFLLDSSQVVIIYEKIPFVPHADSNASAEALTVVPTPADNPVDSAEEPGAIVDNDAIIFSWADLNQTQPDDVYTQVNYFAMFDVGLGDLGCANLSFGANEAEGRFEDSFAPLNASTAFVYTPKPHPDLYDRLTLFSCDWRRGDAITVQLMTPNGAVLEKSFIYGDTLDTGSASATGVAELLVLPDDPFDEGELLLAYTPGAGKAPGEYTFVVTGNGRTLQHTFSVTQPTGARVFTTANLQGYQFWHLAQFEPQETIRVVAYGRSNCVSGDPNYYQIPPNMAPLCFQGWQEFTVDAQGQLLFQTLPTAEFSYFAIVGELSGTFPLDSFIQAEVVAAHHEVRADWLPWFSESLSLDAPRFRLQPGNVVRVIGQSGTQDRVRLSDGTEGWVLAAALDKGNSAVPNDDIPVQFNGDITTLPEWVYLPAGTYFMGSSNFTTQYTEPAEQPQHLVTVNSFWMQRTEVSNASYAACVADSVCTPPRSSASATQANYYGNDTFADYPVLFVTQDQAQAYCQWADGRLPTEAEWEYAARFPTRDVSYYIWGDNPAQADASLANFGKNSGDTIPVTALPDGANEAGLLNLHGNVWEWTSDWFDATYYASSPENNPTGPASGNEKVARGGSWSTNLEFISLTNRFNRSPNQGYDNLGFRCVRVTSP